MTDAPSRVIPFNRPACTGNELAHLQHTLQRQVLTESYYAEKCTSWLQKHLPCTQLQLTPSCTHALEMTALLLGIKPDDEIIMPSYTFASSANAFVLRGATPVFVDIRPDTMNIDETKIEDAITPKTKAILVMHYGGIACDMDAITTLAKKHALPIIEDAAHALMARYKGKALGTVGDIGTYSFHETKNFTSGEGGAIILNTASDGKHAEILSQKGTDKARLMRGEIEYYSWVGLGSSWTMPEMSAAYLYGNLLAAQDILSKRRTIWQRYADALTPLQKQGKIILPTVPKSCTHNAHLFYIKAADEAERTALIAALKKHHITAMFHYIPLHTSPAGKHYGRFNAEDIFTTQESKRLLRLPLFYDMTTEQVEKIITAIQHFYNG